MKCFVVVLFFVLSLTDANAARLSSDEKGSVSIDSDHEFTPVLTTSASDGTLPVSKKKSKDKSKRKATGKAKFDGDLENESRSGSYSASYSGYGSSSPYSEDSKAFGSHPAIDLLSEATILDRDARYEKAMQKEKAAREKPSRPVIHITAPCDVAAVPLSEEFTAAHGHVQAVLHDILDKSSSSAEETARTKSTLDVRRLFHAVERARSKSASTGSEGSTVAFPSHLVVSTESTNLSTDESNPFEVEVHKHPSGEINISLLDKSLTKRGQQNVLTPVIDFTRAAQGAGYDRVGMMSPARAQDDVDFLKQASHTQRAARCAGVQGNLTEPHFYDRRSTKSRVGVLVRIEDGDLLHFIQDELKRGVTHVDPNTLYQIAYQLANQLEKNHSELGLIHLDLKLANVVYSRSPSGEITVRLIDYGCAQNLEDIEKSISSDPARFNPNDYRHSTPPNGAPAYVKAADGADHKAADILTEDVFSLGLILYELSHNLKEVKDGQNLNAILGKVAKFSDYEHRRNSTVNIEDLCTKYGLFCDPTKETPVFAPPAPGTFDALTLSLLVPNYRERSTLKQYLENLEALRVSTLTSASAPGF